MLFFDCSERLHCRIPAALGFCVWAFAAGWRQCGVLRIPFFFYFFLQHVIVLFLSKSNSAFLSKSRLVYPLSIFAFFDLFCLKIVRNFVKLCRSLLIPPLSIYRHFHNPIYFFHISYQFFEG
jgi:hypothetical protein